jgi:thiosulfate/3-mercaptopyruvate sulfurtransferase
MRKITFLLLVTLVLLSAACLGEGVKNAEMTLDTKLSEVTGGLNSTELTAADFMEMYTRGDDFVLIDVRTKREFDEGYIPGAVHIPYTELDTRIDELGLSKDQKIVLYCEAGVRSKKGANALLNREFTNILDVTDGIRGWKALGGEILVPGAVPTQPPSDSGAELSGVLVSAKELLKNLESYKIIFLSPDNQYEDGHIEGALHIDPLIDLVDPSGAVPHIVLKKGDFERLMSDLGISRGDDLVLYDAQRDHKYAARFFWVLKYYGHENAAILDGGLPTWKDGGGKLSTTHPQTQPTEYLVGEIQSDLIATFDYVNQNLDNSDVQLVEATTKEEYEEEGHIPGAVLIEPEATLNSDGTIKNEAELLSLYTSKGVTKDKEIITYCHTGHRGATIWFELKYLLNYPKVRLFDGSLEEWNTRGMPLEKGAEASTTTTSTITTTTVWIPLPTEAPVTEQSFLSVEPIMIFETLDSPIILQMDHWDAVKIEDAYIYITGDFDGCSGEVWWYFNIYRDTAEGGVWEGKTQSYDLYQIHSNQDISPQIHEVSDALDDYTIVVKKWDVQEGLTIEISP